MYMGLFFFFFFGGRGYRGKGGGENKGKRLKEKEQRNSDINKNHRTDLQVIDVLLTLTTVDSVFTTQSDVVEELGEGTLLPEVLLVGAVVVHLAVNLVREHGRLVLLTSLLHRQRLWGGGAGS